jgi:hypothetical protein
MHALLKVFEEEWGAAVSAMQREVVANCAAFAVIAFCGSSEGTRFSWLT